MDEELDPDVRFLAAIEELDSEIASGLPDWMDPSSGGGCPPWPRGGRLSAGMGMAGVPEDERSAFELVDAIRHLEASLTLPLVADLLPRRSFDQAGPLIEAAVSPDTTSRS